MSMPTDAINAILALSPSHLWVMGETGGSTFADQIAGGSGGKSLTAGAGCTPNGWTTIRGFPSLQGYRNVGGPATAGAFFDGSTTGYANASGATIGGTTTFWNASPTSQTGVTLLMWMDSVWNAQSGQVYYAEGSAASTERIAFWNNGGNLQLTYQDSGTGGLVNLTPAGNVRTIQGGQSWTGNHGPVGGQLIGFTINNDGSAWFWQNAKHHSVVTSTKLPNATVGGWLSDGTIKTWLGFHPSTTAPGGAPTGKTVAAPRTDLTNVAQCGANEVGSNLLQTNATSTTGWSKNLAIQVGTDIYTVTSSALVGASAQTVQLTLTSTLKTDLTGSTAAISPIPYGAFRGTLGWCSIFPSTLTPANVDTVYQALTPEPSNGPAWKRSRSGAFYPASQMWNEPLPGPYAHSAPAAAQGSASTPAPADPNTNVVSTWMANGTGKVALTNLIPMVDIDHTGRQTNPDAAPSAVRTEFLAGSDQNAFMRRMPISDLELAQEPRPGSTGSDAQVSKSSSKLGLHYDTIHTFTLTDPNTAAHSPMWHPQIGSPCTFGAGSLAAGTYVYAASYIMGDGSESSAISYSSATNDGSSRSVTGLASGGLHDINVAFTLAATGGIKFAINIDNPVGYYYSPVTVRVYRRGPGSSANSDYRQLADIPVASFTRGANFSSYQFNDDGSFATSGILPYSLNSGFQDPATQQLCNATFGSGVLGPVAFTATASNNGSVAKQPFVINGATPVAGARVYGPGIAAGTTVAASPAPTQTSFYLSQVTLSAQTAVNVGVGLWSPAMTIWGQMAPARAVDVASDGGGGSWDWHANAAFRPNWRPTKNTNNGSSASSCPEGAGFITVEEAVNAGNGDIHAIKHPLMLAIGVSLNSGLDSGSRYPAKRHDGNDLGQTHVNVLKEGMRFRLPATFDPTDTSQYTASTWLTGASPDTFAVGFVKAIAQAMRDYGVFDRDSTGGTGLGILYMEAAAQAGRHPYGSFMGGLTQSGTGANPGLLDPIPWSQLVLLKSYRFPAKALSLATFTATTNATTTLSSVSSFTNCYRGVVLQPSADIAPGTYVQSVNSGAGTATLNQAALTSAAGVTVTPARRTNRLDAGTLGTFGFQQMAPY